MSEPCTPELYAFAHRLADIAGAIIRDGWRAPLAVEQKSDGSPVTAIDRAVEEALRTAIRAEHPSHGVLGEEFPPHQPDAELVWVIDPLDGTKDFIYGLPLFGTLIALLGGQRFLLGLAEQPLTRDRWLGAAGHGTRHNGVPVFTRSCANLAQARVSTMGYDTFCLAEHDRLLPFRAAAGTLITADSFYVFGLLAEGRVDCIVSSGFALHDFAALAAIVENAGGVMTDWQGLPLGRDSGPNVLALGDRALLPEALALLQSAKGSRG